MKIDLEALNLMQSPTYKNELRVFKEHKEGQCVWSCERFQLSMIEPET